MKKQEPTMEKKADKALPEHAENTDNRLLDKKAEKYLRDGANIEDLPDEEELKEMDRLYKEYKKEVS